MKKQPAPRLTLQTAKQIAVKALGTAKGLEKHPDYNYPHYQAYKMQFGIFDVKIRPDIYKSGCIEVCISSGVNSAYALYNPVTNEQDYGAEEQRRRQEKKEAFDEWVGAHGPEHCKKQIDESWGRNR